MLTLNEIVEWNLSGEQVKQLRKCNCKKPCCQSTNKPSKSEDPTDA